jgi:hypothetical protein
MNYRLATILAQEDVSTAATKTIDIGLINPISRINIVYKPTNSNATIIGHPSLCLKKVEIVDGSEVLFSTDGMALRAAAFYGTGKEPVDVPSYNTGDECMFEASMYFGRKLYDPGLALDPTKFKNLQLKITHDKSLGGATPNAATLAVFADLFDEKTISPQGFLMTKEIYSYLPTASAHEYVDLPTDFPYRMILIVGPSHGIMPMWRIDKVKLSEDFDRKLPLPQTDMLQLLQGIVAMYPRIMEHIIAVVPSTETNIPMVAGYEGFGVGGGYGNNMTGISMGNGAGGNIHAYASTTATGAFWLHVGGWCPHNYVLLPTGDIHDIEDFYDVSGLKNLRLDLLAGSTPGTSDNVKVIGQQLRKY